MERLRAGLIRSAAGGICNAAAAILVCSLCWAVAKAVGGRGPADINYLAIYGLVIGMPLWGCRAKPGVSAVIAGAGCCALVFALFVCIAIINHGDANFLLEMKLVLPLDTFIATLSSFIAAKLYARIAQHLEPQLPEQPHVSPPGRYRI